MNQCIKETLLRRKFSSIEYMEELSRFHQEAIKGMEESIDWFYAHPPQEDWKNWHISDRPDGWEKRAIPNFLRNQASIEEGIDYARRGDLDYIEGASGNLMSLSKDMDVLGWKWWKNVDEKVARRFGENLAKAEQIASNIWRTIGGYWRPGSILKENITGPVDEKDLLRYLQPGDPYP